MCSSYHLLFKLISLILNKNWDERLPNSVSLLLKGPMSPWKPLLEKWRHTLYTTSIPALPMTSVFMLSMTLDSAFPSQIKAPHVSWASLWDYRKCVAKLSRASCFNLLSSNVQVFCSIILVNHLYLVKISRWISKQFSRLYAYIWRRGDTNLMENIILWFL